MPNKTSKTNKKRSILGLITYLFGLIWQIISKNRERDKIEENKQEMQSEWNKIDEDQKEDFAFIDSMQVEDLKNKIDR